MIPFNRPAALFSLNTYLAAILALFVAFSVDLPRPFWAMMTAYITSQPFSGAVRSKAIYRVCGTLIGSCAALIMVPNLVDAPELLTLALGLWVAGCLTVSLLDRTPRAYGFMLAGYTAALVGFPSVVAPDQIFQTAVARAEEISLGAICAALVHGLLFPADLLPKILADLRRMLRDAEHWTADAMAAGVFDANLIKDRRRLSADATDLFLTSTHLPFDAAASPAARRALVAVQDRFVSLIPLLTALADRIHGLHEKPPAMTALLQAAQAWARHCPDDPRVVAADLIRDARALQAATQGQDWQSLVATNLYARLIEVIETLQAARELIGLLVTPHGKIWPHLTALINAAQGRQLHHDPLPAFRSGLSVLVVVAISASFWIATGWQDGATATMIGATFTCLFATQDDPRPMLRSMVLYVIAALPVTAFYSFAVLPAVDGFVMLSAALAPALLVMGYFMARPGTAGRAMGFMMGFVGGLALQSAYNADFAVFLNGNVAQLLGAFFALIGISLCRVIGAEAAVRRLVRVTAFDLAKLARARRVPDLHSWSSRMIDRDGLLVQRLAAIEPDGELRKTDLLTDLRTGANIIGLVRARRCLAEHNPKINDLFKRLVRYFQARARGRTADGAELLASIDCSLALFAEPQPSPDRNLGIAALVGLRRNLFPHAPDYVRPDELNSDQLRGEHA